MPLIPFVGNRPGNINRDAKYAVRSGGGAKGSTVALTYRAENDERWHATTEDHPKLVKMVNDVKIAASDSPNGPFYINEYRQVIVPAGKDATYYYAGEYDNGLYFEFEGHTLCGDGRGPDKRQLTPGDRWDGPHPGIPYTLAAGGKDLHYEFETRPDVTKKVTLSKTIGAEAAAAFCRKLREIKGFEGGRIYVNEWRQMFTPLTKTDGLEYVYLGAIDLAIWFPKPQVSAP